MLNEDTPRKTSKADPGADTQVLVRFREDGDKPPLYFFPAGYGDMRLFREVAALLDDDQPVYGLQPPRAELVEGLHNKPAQWLISLYIMEIKRVQPKGPYHLAGYSSSGLFAAEAARQLIRKGDAVDLLVLLDPPVRIPPAATLFYLSLCKLFDSTHLTNTIRWMIIRRWNNMFFRWISDKGLYTNIAILQDHEIASYPGRITFFRPRRSLVRWVNWASVGRSWHKIARDGLEVHRIPGAHNEILRGRQAKILAAALKGCLRRSEYVGPTPRFQHPTSCEVTHNAKTVYSVSVKQGRIDEVFDWDEMERLHRKGLIPDPVNIADSGAFIESESREAAAAFHRLLGAGD